MEVANLQPPVPGLATIRQRESELLAPYAVHSADCRGRRHPESQHPYRGPFQRDRDRILHSGAYRRLSGKMQVFTGDMGDYHRTRLTHTHEVASIARTIGRALRLNEDLIEALALFHDVGHPPFGHAGEAALDECLASCGGFSHNRHALTIAEELEMRYPSFPGLNLTHEVLEGQKHRSEKEATWKPSLEVRVVDVADSITYDAHDTDDAVKLGLVTLPELEVNSLLSECVMRVRQRHATLDDNMLRKAVVHELIDRQVSDVLSYVGPQLADRQPSSAEEARAAPIRLDVSRELQEKKVELEAFLFERVYRHPHLIQVRRQAQTRLQSLFCRYVEHPEFVPEQQRRRIEMVGVERAIGEYVAGMTDRFCDQQYNSHFGEGGEG